MTTLSEQAAPMLHDTKLEQQILRRSIFVLYSLPLWGLFSVLYAGRCR